MNNQSDLTGRTFGKYKLYNRLGIGGMARVYKAYQSNLDRYVALKVLHAYLAEEDEFIGRFEREAAAVARMRHPNIVQVFDYDIEGDSRYMVMEYIEGPTLKAELDHRDLSGIPFTFDEINHIITSLAKALVYAHTRGIIHRDIKPANIMFTLDGDVVLTDFGIVRMVGLPRYTLTGMVAGTPTYMAPEQAQSLTIDHRSDIYSLGVILYELITGHTPFSGDTPMEIIKKHVDEPLPEIDALEPVPPEVEQVINKAMAKDPDERFQTAVSLATALQAALGQTAVTQTTVTHMQPLATAVSTRTDPATPVLSPTFQMPDTSPYRGLFAFGEEDAANFFGREAFSQRLLDTVERQRLLAIVGASGSGKSSVVFAGLVAKLRTNRDWHIITLRPGPQPFHALAAALVAHQQPTLSKNEQRIAASQLANDLRFKEVALLPLLRQILDQHKPTKQLLIVSDQFEEIYTLCNDPQLRRAFLDLLLEAVDVAQFRHLPHFTLVLTLRTDFLSQALTYRPFADALQNADIKLGPMTRRELSQAIANPARRFGLLFETGLVARILDDVGDEPGNLPLLQFALTELWDKAREGYLTHEGYEAIGGVEGALARYADQEFSQLTAAERQQARRVFIQMVRPGAGTEDTRRLAERSELGESNWQLVQKLANARLVVTSLAPNGQETVEVVHEALIRGWGQLRAWMDEDRAFRAWQERLRAALRQWQMSELDSDALLRGALLAEAEGWLNERESFLSREERFFINESLKLRTAAQAALEEEQLERQQAAAQARVARRLSWLTAALVITIVLLLIVAFSAINSNQVAQANAATAQANEGTAVALQEASEFSQATSVAAEATARADASLRATAEYAAGQEREIAELSAQDAIAAQETAVFSANELATAVAIAEENAQEAENQSRLVGARELAGIATDQLNSDPQLGLLLSLEAVNLTQSLGLAAPESAEDALFRAMQSSQLQRIFSGHTGGINDVAFSSDGRLLATASQDTEIKLWDVGSGQEIGVLTEHGRAVNAVAFNPDSTILATAGDDGFIILWNTATQQLVAVLNGQEGAVTDLAFNPAGDRLLASYDSSALRLWDVGNRRSLLRLLGHTSRVQAVAFSQDGRRFASGGADGRIIIWNGESGASLFSIEPSSGSDSQLIQINGLTYSPDDAYLLAANSNGTAAVWSANNASLVFRVTGHAVQLDDVAYSPDGLLFATASSDSTVKVWNAASGQALYTLPGHTNGVTAVAFHPTEPQLITGSGDSTARLWRTESGLSPQILSGHTGTIRTISFSADGRFLATGGADETARIWRTEDNTQVAAFTDHNNVVNDVGFAPNGALLATVSDDQNARLWDIASGEIKLPVMNHPAVVNGVAFSPEGTVLATTAADGILRFWNPEDNSLQLRLPYGSELTKVSFSPDGSLVAAGSVDGTAVIWSVVTNEIVQTLAGHEGAVNDVAFSGDGRFLATASSDGTARLWSAENGEALRVFSGHGGPVLSVALSQDGNRLATGSADRTTKLWDTATGQTRRTYLGHTSTVNDVVFDPSDGRLATASADRTARINTLETVQNLFERAKFLVTRSLSADECTQYLRGRPCLSFFP
ncbi:protein kinase domain-containing protein [Candidatus Leptofilum sp.]|uniref:WD40 repeat domain-containing serine/threonine protein kinase n=1 Tax=Candidatus Leptofilum sp. TaxID=3241576 RepID=UPI003B58E2CF